MTALTALLNPLGGKEALLFFRTEDSNLGLLQEGVDDTILGGEGNIKDTCSLAAMNYNNLISVYGITNEAKISMLSPVYAPVYELITPYDGLAATCSDSNSGLLFFLREDPPKVLAWDFKYSNERHFQTTQPLSSTRLAAFSCSSRDQSVCYQGADGIHVLKVQDELDTCISLITNAKENTPLAVSALKKQDVDVVYLYYADKSDQLQRAVRDGSGLWKLLPPPTPAVQLAHSTDLSVMPNPDNRVNNVYYRGVKPDQQIECYPDNL